MKFTMKKKIIFITLLVTLIAAVIVLGACSSESVNGKSAYELYVDSYIEENGSSDGVLSKDDWLLSLKGEQGPQGEQGEPGLQGSQGDTGLSAYEIYCKHHPVYSGTEQEWINAYASGELAASYKTEYNIIFTLATVPPVMAALESLNSGLPTYALIERGKTYSGIKDIDNFYNIGFNPSNNLSNGFTNELFNTVVNQIKELNVFGNEKFNIYLCDYTGLYGVALAANARLRPNQYHLYLCEDGGQTYDKLRNCYVDNKTVDSTMDQPYEAMRKGVSDMQTRIGEISSRTDNRISDLEWDYNIIFPMASLDNVTYLMQDEVRVKNYLEELGSSTHRTKLLSAVGIEGYNDTTEIKLNFEFGSISNKVEKLNNDKKQSYLKLMYGDYLEDTYNTLTRSTLSDNVTTVPIKKLVFISSRVKSYPQFATNSDGVIDFGYAAAKSVNDVPDSYADLDEMYKTDFLFGKEEDYQLFINQLKLAENYNDGILPEQATLDAIRVDCFNYYIDYLFTLKFTYLLYGRNYDIILKGHPSEVIGEHDTWTQHYDAGAYRYDKLYDNLLLAFHTNDSIGKFIGLIPFGTAAENLAYLGADISLCGLTSSTYTGYEQSVDIKFVMSRTNYAIDSDTNLNGRYAVGTLLDHDEEGTEQTTAFFNIGNIYKELISYYSNESTGDASQKDKYVELFNKWLRKVNDLQNDADTSGYDVDRQGFLIKP